MERLFDTDVNSLAHVAIAAVVMYLVTIVVVRLLVGLRSFAKISATDFAITIALGTVLGTTTISGSISIPEGAVGVATLFGVKWAVGVLRVRTSWGSKIDNAPVLVMAHGEIVEENLVKAKLSRADLAGKLREANVRTRDEVIAVVVEATGDVSVIHAAGETEVDELVMEGVRGAERLRGSRPRSAGGA